MRWPLSRPPSRRLAATCVGTPGNLLRLLPAIQVNIRTGHFSPADVNGVQYLREPVKLAAEREVRPSFSL
jgi:hypothetical protein